MSSTSGLAGARRNATVILGVVGACVWLSAGALVASLAVPDHAVSAVLGGLALATMWAAPLVAIVVVASEVRPGEALAAVLFPTPRVAYRVGRRRRS